MTPPKLPRGRRVAAAATALAGLALVGVAIASGPSKAAELPSPPGSSARR